MGKHRYRDEPAPLKYWACRASMMLQLALLGLVVSACNGDDDQPERKLVLGGALDRPAMLSLSQIKDMPDTSQNVNYLAGTTPQTHTYTGTSLWGLIDQAGIQVDASRRNDLLNRYALATGGDGYKVVFGLGEINPDFGNRASLVVYYETLNGMTNN